MAPRSLHPGAIALCFGAEPRWIVRSELEALFVPTTLAISSRKKRQSHLGREGVGMHHWAASDPLARWSLDAERQPDKMTLELSGRTIAVIGLGYVGLPLAVEFGKIRPVIGFDLRKARVDELQAGCDSTREVEVEDLAAAKQLTYSHSSEDLKRCGVFIIAVPTPIDRANRPDLTLLVRASETVGQTMGK